jgi:hypothetical protein
MAHDAGFNAVFVQNRAHFIRRQVNICLAVIALNKAVAISVTRNGAFKFG